MRDRIFFRDKRKELKGPFTEREVQEWYRKGWFDHAIPFYFVGDGESPAQSTSEFKLDELLIVNGIGCPFKWFDRSIIEEERKREKRRAEEVRERTEELKQKIAAIRASCDKVEDMKRRLEIVERKVENLPLRVPSPNVFEGATSGSASEETQAASTSLLRSGSGGRTGIEKHESFSESRDPGKVFRARVRELHEASEGDAEMARLWVDLFHYIFDCLGERATLKLSEDECKDFLEEQYTWSQKRYKKMRKVMFELLVKSVNEMDYLFCAPCDRCFTNHKQVATHVGKKEHEQAALETDNRYSLLTVLLRDMFSKERIDEYTAEYFREWKTMSAKYHHITEEDAERVPTEEFLSHLRRTYDKTVLNFKGKSKASAAKILRKVFSQITGDVGRSIMREIEDHIGDSDKTFCDACFMYTGTAQEFYRHKAQASCPLQMNQDLELDLEIVSLAIRVHHKSAAVAAGATIDPQLLQQAADNEQAYADMFSSIFPGLSVMNLLK